MLPFSCILAKKRAAQTWSFFFHEADGLSCTKQVPLVVDLRAATEVAVRENASWCRWYFAVLNIHITAAGQCSLPYGRTSACSRKKARAFLASLCCALVRAVHESAMRPRC